MLYRTEGWDFLLAGGGLYNNLDYSFTSGQPDGTRQDYRSPGGGSVELRRQLGILKRFLEAFDFVRMNPDNSTVVDASPDLVATALSERGRSYAIYLHVPLPNKPRDLRQHLRANVEATLTLDLPAGRYASEWVDTKTGEVTPGESFDHQGGHRRLRSPRFDDDVALRVLARENSR